MNNYTFKEYNDKTISVYKGGLFQCNLNWSMDKVKRVFK